MPCKPISSIYTCIYILQSSLTFLTVRSLPASEADNFTSLRASVVSELIVTWPTEIRTAGAIIMWIAGDTKIVFQPGVLGFRFVGLPLRRDLENLLHRQPLDEQI